jgi:hypothetical protein
MKKIISVLFIACSFGHASVPRDEGLLRNPNNANVAGSVITIKAEIKKITDGVKESEGRNDFYKFVFVVDNNISLFQINYSGSQMLNNQIQDVKIFNNLSEAIKADRIPEKGMFYGVLTMLATNRSDVMESFIERTGSSITKNKSLLNEEKLKLLKTYRNYLINVKGKGEASSPLNPQDPNEKAKVVELFRANTYEPSKNIELVKEGNEFLWKADWKSVKALFTNEERRLKYVEFSNVSAKARIDVQDFTMFNNVNELPKSTMIKDSLGNSYKMTIFYEDVKKSQEKKIADRYEEAKKLMPKAIDPNEIFSFLL